VYLQDRRLLRLYLLLLPALFTLSWAAQSMAAPADLQAPTGSPRPVTEAGAESIGGISPVPGKVPGSSLAQPAAAGTGAGAVNEAGREMTGFFVIGMIINVLLLTLFLIWAVGQWRKTKK
jgi:hypothetical protein